MKLHHFTSALHLRGIGLYGLTVGDVPTNLASNAGRCGVWLTSDSNSEGHGLGGRCDKKRFRLTVDAPDNGLLVRWVEWSAKYATPDTVRNLHSTAPRFNSWYVYFGIIPRSAIIDCVDMQTGSRVENWADRPPSPLDIEPVPPWRRAAGHKKLLRNVAKELVRIGQRSQSRK